MLTASRNLLSQNFIVNKLSLALILILAIAYLIFPAMRLGQWLCLPNWLLLIVISLPVTTAISCFFLALIRRRKSNFFTGTKFTKFPLCLFFDPEPVKYGRFNRSAGWSDVIEDGDLLVRRHDRCLDGIFLRQAGYFTHAGIAKKEKDDIYVYHAVGSGVQKIPLNNFAHCDDIMVLRITREQIENYLQTDYTPPKQPESILQKTNAVPVVFESRRNKKANEQRAAAIKEKASQPEYTEIAGTTQRSEPTVRTRVIIEEMIQESLQAFKGYKPLAEKELEVFKMLNDKDPAILNKPWQRLITDLAEFYCNQKIQYDFSFDFTSPDKMSCVEFAWNCYKCFYPLHRIKRKSYSFFYCLKPLILAPDQFPESEAFTHVFNSVGAYPERQSFIDFCKKKALNFWEFILTCIASQVILLLAAAGIYKLIETGLWNTVWHSLKSFFF